LELGNGGPRICPVWHYLKEKETFKDDNKKELFKKSVRKKYFRKYFKKFHKRNLLLSSPLFRQAPSKFVYK